MSKKTCLLFSLVAGFLGFLLLMGQAGCKSESPTTTDPIVVTCSVNNSQGNTGVTFQFSCNASGGDGSFSYSWDFGDGQTSNQQNPGHSYDSIGNFTVRVTVTSGTETANCAQSIKVFIERSVFVGPGGGAADVVFKTVQSGRIRISLNGAATLMPYGYLQGPGYSDYFPPMGTSNNGVNIGELNLTQAGNFTLTVFDGNNDGGNINVRIEVI
ncbi:MAG: PKD domain-containing protein [Candidatus Aminicenantes bacterium]|nr:PKD domain-containing protein [Candidatus Aminicenantes bacterium]